MPLELSSPKVIHRQLENRMKPPRTWKEAFAVLRRGLDGVYHHASKKHIGRNVDEFTFRLNEGNEKRHTWDRLDSFVSAVAGKRLTYERLTK